MNHYVRKKWAYQHVCIILISLALLVTSATANAALNRKSVVALLKEINADYDSGHVGVYINDLVEDSDPLLLAGDSLSYTINSNEERYLLLVLVDPKGLVSIVFPDFALRDTPGRYNYFVYPPVDSGEFEQNEPVGIETIFVLASTKAVLLSDFNFPADSDIHSIEKNTDVIERFVGRINDLLKGSVTDAAVYQYAVDSDVQFSTRAVRRELKRRVQQVDVLAEQGADSKVPKPNGNRNPNGPRKADAPIESDALAVNDIRFESNSDALTRVGRVQLDLFGSELLEIWEANPTITVTFEGHTDDTGDEVYNQQLSERRANSAMQYLIKEFDLPVSNMFTRGMGENMPLTVNEDATSRALNRRVEIRVGVNVE